MKVIFDLDGTIADINHRTHFVRGGNKDWESFFAGCVADVPNAPVVAAFNVKAKGEDYVLKHRAKESVLQEKNVLALIVRDELDDVLPLLDTSDRANVERYRKDVLAGIAEAEDILAHLVSSSKGLDQKTFATVLLAGVIPQVRSLAFQVRAGANPRSAIVSSILKSSTSASGVDHVRPLFGATFNAVNDNGDVADAA